MSSSREELLRGCDFPELPSAAKGERTAGEMVALFAPKEKPRRAGGHRFGGDWVSLHSSQSTETNLDVTLEKHSPFLLQADACDGKQILPQGIFHSLG